MKIPFSHLNSAEKLRLLTIALWFALGIWVVYLGIYTISSGIGNDFRVFSATAQILAAGKNPYQSAGISLVLPWVIILFTPLTLLPFETAIRIWAGINWLLIVISLILTYRLCHRRLPSWIIPIICIALVIIDTRCLTTAQTGLFVMVAILAGYNELIKNKPFRAGLIFSLFILKPWIAAGAVIAAMLVIIRRKQPKFLIGLISGDVCIILISLIVWPAWPFTISNVDVLSSFEWPLATIFDFTKYVLGLPVTPFFVSIQTFVVTIAAIILIYFALRAWQLDLINDMFLIGVGTIITLLVVPYIRYYDYTVLTFWFVSIVPCVITAKSFTTLSKIVFIFLTIGGTVFTFGTHFESEMYVIVILFYVATLIAVLSTNPIHVSPKYKP